MATLEISLFGTCVVRVACSTPFEIKGAKHRALIAMLAASPMGRRTRSHLQNTLWGDAGYDSGHQNLRRALSDLRKQMGPHFDKFIHTTNTDLELNPTHLRYIGDPHAGPFLDDLHVLEPKFTDWVAEIRSAPEQVAGLYRTRTTQRTRPRVTALPLTVLGNDPDLRILGDWVAEETCRSLSRSNLLSVISHLSSRAMAQTMIDIAQVRKTLDVDYLVTGTLRRVGLELIADFDFVDAHNGDILWNRHLTCPANTFNAELQGRLANVIQAIGRSIANSAVRYVRDRPLPDIDDHHLIVAGVSLMHRSPMRDFIKSRNLLVEAQARMPNIAEAHAWLAKWYVLSVFKGYSTDRNGDTQKALDCTARALDMDPENSFGLTIDGFAHSNLLKNLDVADQRYGAALDINPNESLAWLLRGASMAFQDEGAAAIRATTTARRLSPIDPFGYYYDSLASTAHIAAEDFEMALIHANKSLAVNDRHLSTLRTRTTALHFLGRHAEARATFEDLIRKHPTFNIDDYKRNHPSAGNRAGQRVIEALTASGLNL